MDKQVVTVEELREIVDLQLTPIKIYSTVWSNQFKTVDILIDINDTDRLEQLLRERGIDLYYEKEKFLGCMIIKFSTHVVLNEEFTHLYIGVDRGEEYTAETLIGRDLDGTLHILSNTVIKTGVEKLDEIYKEGIPRDKLILFSGNPRSKSWFQRLYQQELDRRLNKDRVKTSHEVEELTKV